MKRWEIVLRSLGCWKAGNWFRTWLLEKCAIAVAAPFLRWGHPEQKKAAKLFTRYCKLGSYQKFPSVEFKIGPGKD